MTDDPVTTRRERRSALDMPSGEFRALGHSLVEQIAAFLDSLRERPVTRAELPVRLRAIVGTAELPESGTGAAELLADTARTLFEHSLHNGHPRFFGYITSSAAPLGMLADLLASALNANVAKWDLSPLASEIEAQTIRWLADFTGYPADCGGLMVSGGTMANLLAFVAARRAVAPWDIRRTGNVGDRPRLTVYVSTRMHTWIDKAADVCGIGAAAIRWIETDRYDRMRVERLREQLDADLADGCLPFLVVGTAGNVSTGAVDPLRKIATVCRDYRVWFHVDGAYGAAAAILPEAPADLHALALADSVSIDPHKWLYCPIEAACVLAKKKDALRDAFAHRPDYYRLDDDVPGGIDYYEHGLQNTRGFRALKVWLMLQQAGRAGYRDSIRGDMELARSLFDRLTKHPEFEAHSVHLSIVTFRFVPQGVDPGDAASDARLDRLNRSLLAELQTGRQLFLSNAVANGRYLLRACIVNFRTLQQDVDALPAIVADIGRRLDRAMRAAVPEAGNATSNETPPG